MEDKKKERNWSCK